LFNPAANGECGPWLTSGFGGTIPVTQRDPRTFGGWGVRPWNWEFSTGFQHELTRRVSAGLSYYRRVNGNFLVTDNTANTAADFKEFSLTVPSDSRRPASGQKLTVFDINPTLTDGRPFNTTSNVVKPASDYGQQFLHWDGFDINSNVRLQEITFQGGVTFGKTMSDNCQIVSKLPEVLGNTPKEFCHNETGWQQQWKVIGSYDLPWQNIRFSSNFQSLTHPVCQIRGLKESAVPLPTLERRCSWREGLTSLKESLNASGCNPIM
jgi:hypothetical protein